MKTVIKNISGKNNNIKSAIAIVLYSASALFVAGCATNGIQEDQPPKLDLAKYSTLTSHDAVTNLEASYQSSDINELAIYAPQHYSTAGKAIKDAKALLKKSQPRNQVVQKVAVAEALLKNGGMVMRRVKDILEDEISIKQKLDKLNTASAYGSEYGSLNNRLNKLILTIESGIEADEQNREKLLKDMQQLERKSLRFNAMNEPREILKRVKNSGGPQLAPNTYNEALAVFKRADEFIKQNPNYNIGITQIGREALFAAKRALYITEGVSSLKQKFAFAPEQIILDEEYRMYRVARQLASLDYRDNSLEVQSEKLAEEAAALALELRNKDDLVIALRDTLIEVRDSSTRLTMLSDSAEKLAQEKNEWLAKEALFKAKVDQLAEALNTAETQLDSTQQTLLSFRNENARLTQQVQNDVNNADVLQSELAQLKQLKQQQQLQQQKQQEAETFKQAEKIKTEIAKNQPAPKNNTIENSTSDDKTNKIAKTSVTAQKTTRAPTIVQTEDSHLANNTDDTNDEKIISIKPITSEVTNNEAVAATPVSKKERAKITAQEAFEAIQSAKELIHSLKNTEHKLVESQPNDITPSTFDQEDDFLDDEDSDVFVDASD